MLVDTLFIKIKIGSNARGQQKGQDLVYTSARVKWDRQPPEIKCITKTLQPHNL